MPFDSGIGQNAVAARDEPKLGSARAAQAATTSPALPRYREEWRGASTNECWPERPAALPTNEDIRYAHELRLQLRRRYLARAASPSRAWCIDAD